MWKKIATNRVITDDLLWISAAGLFCLKFVFIFWQWLLLLMLVFAKFWIKYVKFIYTFNLKAWERRSMLILISFSLFSLSLLLLLPNRFSPSWSSKTKKKNTATKSFQSKVIAVCRVSVYPSRIVESSSKTCRLFSMQRPPFVSMKNSNWHWPSMLMAQKKSCCCQNKQNPWW